MTQFDPPSRDPAGRGDLTSVVRLILTKFLQGVDDMLPARVVAYDRETNRARVQPLITVVTTSGTVVERAQIASVPVLQLGGGGYVISFPIREGDLGWIKANDRDISLFKQLLEMAKPNTQRKHSFSDAVFIPDTMFKNVSIDDEDAENVVLQSLDGTVRIALWEDKVKVTAPNVVVVASDSVNITAPTITCTASTSITLDTPLTTITGAIETGTGGGGADATFNGNVIATGEITTQQNGGIPLSSHKHTGVQTGGGNTGDPIP